MPLRIPFKEQFAVDTEQACSRGLQRQPFVRGYFGDNTHVQYVKLHLCEVVAAVRTNVGRNRASE